jgi:hypothetical protein
MMAGYRERSSFDPYGLASRPARPFNWVQWTGVGLDVIGIGLYLVYFAGRVGWIAPKVSSPMIALPLIMLAIPLINSRREPVPNAPELAAARLKWMVGTVIVCAVIFGIAAIIAFARS